MAITARAGEPATSRTSSAVPEPLAVQARPSGEVSRAPAAPTATKAAPVQRTRERVVEGRAGCSVKVAPSEEVEITPPPTTTTIPGEAATLEKTIMDTVPQAVRGVQASPFGEVAIRAYWTQVSGGGRRSGVSPTATSWLPVQATSRREE